jgi:hypothetical protein
MDFASVLPGVFDYFLGPALYFALDYWRLAQGPLT